LPAARSIRWNVDLLDDGLMLVAQTNWRLTLGVDQFMRLGLDTMARFGSGSLLEHSQIKFKWLSIPEVDHGELCMVRIQ